MLSILGAGALSLLERELMKYEPLVQQFVITQLDSLSKLLVQYVANKLHVNPHLASEEDTNG
jgi:hypothetical protein